MSSATMNTTVRKPTTQQGTSKKYRLPREVRSELNVLVGNKDVSRDTVQNDLFNKYKANPELSRHVVYFLVVEKKIGFDKLFGDIRRHIDATDPVHADLCRQLSEKRVAFTKK